jgi:hypothetical protein
MPSAEAAGGTGPSQPGSSKIISQYKMVWAVEQEDGKFKEVYEGTDGAEKVMFRLVAPGAGSMQRPRDVFETFIRKEGARLQQLAVNFGVNGAGLNWCAILMASFAVPDGEGGWREQSSVELPSMFRNSDAIMDIAQHLATAVLHFNGMNVERRAAHEVALLRPTVEFQRRTALFVPRLIY